jgi:hypothetical protein
MSGYIESLVAIAMTLAVVALALGVFVLGVLVVGPWVTP